jgi:hypothetical protein
LVHLQNQTGVAGLRTRNNMAIGRKESFLIKYAPRVENLESFHKWLKPVLAIEKVKYSINGPQKFMVYRPILRRNGKSKNFYTMDLKTKKVVIRKTFQDDRGNYKSQVFKSEKFGVCLVQGAA